MPSASVARCWSCPSRPAPPSRPPTRWGSASGRSRNRWSSPWTARPSWSSPPGSTGGRAEAGDAGRQGAAGRRRYGQARDGVFHRWSAAARPRYGFADLGGREPSASRSAASARRAGKSCWFVSLARRPLERLDTAQVRTVAARAKFALEQSLEPRIVWLRTLKSRLSGWRPSEWSLTLRQFHWRPAAPKVVLAEHAPLHPGPCGSESSTSGPSVESGSSRRSGLR
jgi:hypothetical protein